MTGVTVRVWQALVRWLMLLCVVTASAPAIAAAPVLRIAAAADLAPCIDALNRGFAAVVAGADLKASIGSSGTFFAQIKNGAPFDIFLSADMHYPQALADAGLADAATLMVYAHGQLVIWSNDPQIDVSRGWDALRDPRVQHIAIANPVLAPYGRAAKAALMHAGVWALAEKKLVLGENVLQTAQFIQTGNAQLGLISLSHINGLPAGVSKKVWLVPATAYPLIEQGAIVTTAGRNNPLALQYLAFLRSPAGRAILQHYRFQLPPLSGARG